MNIREKEQVIDRRKMFHKGYKTTYNFTNCAPMQSF